MTFAEHLSTFLPSVLGFERAWPWLLAATLIGFVIGSIPFGVLVARAFGLGDLRTIGSGNIGATNVLRTGSKKAAALTLAADMAKGGIPVAIILMVWGPLPAQLAGIGAFFGHLYSPWLGFRGGKGVATFLGIILGLNPLAGVLCCASWLAFATLFRISSLAALLMSVSSLFWLWILEEPGALWVALLLLLLIWVKHNGNIRRILTGTEPRIRKN